jgi:hypothetical protein
MLVVFIDADAFRWLARPEALASVTAGVGQQRLRLFCSETAARSLLEGSDEVTRRALLRVPVAPVSTAALVWAKRRWATACWSPPVLEALVRDHRLEGLRHRDDALLVATAHEQGAAVVCVDAQLSASCRRHGVAVLHPASLVDLLDGR